MKKLNVLVILSFIPLFSFSQSIFDRYEDMNNVGVVVLNKKMIDLLTKRGNLSDNEEFKEFAQVTKEVKSIKVFNTEDKDVSQSMAISVKKHVKSSAMEELVRLEDKGVVVKCYAKYGKGEDYVSELLMLFTGMKDVDIGGRKFETVLVSITGDIDLNEISVIANNMNLPKALNIVERVSSN